MSDGGADPTRALAGDIATEVTRELTDPVRGLRDRLGLVVDHLERHVGTATGPAPYPWKALQSLRQDLAAAYLEATHLARRLDELARAITPEPGAAGWIDAGAAVDLGLRLAGHHITADVELLFDLGDVPLARGVTGPLALLVAQLVTAGARSAQARPGSSLSVRVSADEPDAVVIAIADNGDGSPDADRLAELARTVLRPWSGTVAATSAAGRGCAFELRLAAMPTPD